MVAMFVIGTVVMFVLADAVVQWAESKRRQAAGLPGMAPGALVPVGAFDDASAPQGIFLHPGHAWAGLQASGTVRVGMDGFVQSLLGVIDGVELPKEGARIGRGETLFTVRQGRRKASFQSPLEGIVTTANRNLETDPSPIGQDPFQKGWICTLSPTNLARNLKELRIAEEAAEWIREEIRSFGDFLASRPVLSPALGAVAPDGGQPTKGLLQHMDDPTWKQFESRFLHR